MAEPGGRGGPTLVVGDVHGCAEELAALLERVRPGRLVLLGDLFTRGPDPAGVWALIRDWRAEAVLGNHDAWLLGRPEALPALPAAARRWLAGRPTLIEEDGWVAVHAGLVPGRPPAEAPRRVRLDVRRWPDDADPAHPFWWSLWRGPPRVVFGHDARRGLVDRRPHALGLDTGCVYGGALTGWVVEDDRLVREPARRRWWDPVRRRPTG